MIRPAPRGMPFSGSLARSIPTLLALLTLSALGGCSSERTTDSADTAQQQPDAGVAQQADGATSGVEPLRADQLSPSFSTIGAKGVVPERIAIRFDRPVAAPGQNTPGEGTEYRITPETSGSLRFTSRSTLVFVPDDGFEPATEYTFELSKLEVDRPAESADAGDEQTTRQLVPSSPWQTSVKTPDFEFLSLSPAAQSAKRLAVEVDISFSAPVEADRLAGYADWMLDGQPVTDVQYASGHKPNVVRATVRHPDLRSPSSQTTLEFMLQEGLPHGETLTAPAARANVDLKMGPPLEIEEVILKEGNDGFYFHVVCDDDAAGGYDSRYDRTIGRSFRVSERCEPDPKTVEQFVEVSPEVDLRVSPAEAGFRILGDFERKSYNLQIKTGLTSIDGGVLRSTWEKTFEVPARSPLVDIPASGRYITEEMWKNLAVRHRNVHQLDLTVRHVPRDNMVFWMSGEDEQAGRRTSNVVLDTKVPVKNTLDETRTSWIDVKSRVGEPKPGIYQVELGARQKTATARLLVTNINLIVKKAAPPPDAEWSRNVLVWAREMETNEAMRDIEIKTIRRSGDVLSRCETGADGGCRLKLPPKRIDPSPPFAIVAQRGEDITYLKYSELKSELLQGDLHGEPYRSDKPYTGSLNTERGVYRPGETAHLVGVLRKEDHTAPKAGMPVTVKLRDPRGRLVREEVIETNAAGTVALDYGFADMAATGKWRAKLVVADKPAASHTFNVEEFVPERMDVSAQFARQDYAFADQAEVGVEAEYLFGASAKGSRVDLRCRVTPSEFEPEQNADFNYGPIDLDTDFEPVSMQTVQGEIGEDGSTSMKCPSLQDSSPFPTTGELIANVDVYESGSGRTTQGRAAARIHPESYYVGLRSETEKVEQGKTYRVEGIVVDWKGQPVSPVETIDVEFANLAGEWTRYYDSQRGRTRWKRHLRPVMEGTKTVEVGDDGRFSIEVTPGEIEDGYLVRARSGNARAALQFDPERRHYWHRGPQETRDRTPRPMAPTAMPVDVPEPIEVGEEHQMTFTAPYKGKALVTVETDQVIEHEWLSVDAGKNTWSFTLEDFHANVYLGAFLVKDPHLESEEAFLPDRAFGMSSAKVRPTQFIQSVDVKTPEEIEPNRTLEVEVDAGEIEGPAYVTVAAVDEGILSLTNYETPDPLDDIFAKRALGVDTYDTVGWALSLPPRGQSSATGGGSGRGAGGRIMPVEPVALWSGVQKLPADGRKTIELFVPRYRGALRVMTHVYTPERVGHTDQEVKVRDPLPVQTTTPRFMTARDEVEIPVFVSNMTDRDRDITVEISARALERGGPGEPAVVRTSRRQAPLIDFQTETRQTISVPKGESGTAVFVARATRLAGAAEFRIEANSGEHTSIDDSVVPFRASGPRERVVKQIEVEGNRVDLTKHVTGWKKTSETTTFWLTNLKHGRSFDKAKRLIRYPHGCVEQTTSTTRPLLFVSEFLRAVDPSTVASAASIDKKVKHGIDRVLSMQTPSGGIGYWPGASDPHPWGTTYATHMLLDAKEQGYDVPEKRLDDALDWLKNYASKHDGQQSGRHYTHLGTNGEAYMHYVLARSGRANKAKIVDLINGLSSNPDGKERETAYLLKAALFQAGDRRFEKELKNPTTGSQMGGRETGGSFYSDQRSRAFILNIYQELFGEDGQVAGLVDQVARDLQQKDSHWYTTQELVWGITGMGKWFQSNEMGEISNARLVAEGRKVEPTVEGKSQGFTWKVARASEFDSLSLEFDRQKEGSLYLVVSSEGVRQNPSYNWGGNGLQLRREYLDRQGNAVNFTGHRLGDVVYTRITVQNTSGGDLQNIALIDRFPAGWEVENPRLGGAGLPDFVDRGDLWQVDHMDIRDDRVAFFGDLQAGAEATLVFSTRATLAGEFTIPPVSAEAMYDPTIWAQKQGQRISIAGPWSQYLD